MIMSYMLLYCCAMALVSGVYCTRVSDSPLVSKIETFDAVKVTDVAPIDESPAAPERNLQSCLPQLYHTPEIFALNYKEMRENLKVFIYPNSQNTSYEYDVTSERMCLKGGGSELQFLNLLRKDVFVTKDPEEAHLFFMPLSITALVAKLGHGEVGHHVRHYVQGIRENFTFWNRSLGSDHFYIATEEYEPFNHRNNLEFGKNAIKVACSPLRPLQFFYPHKDIALPSYQWQTVLSRNPAAIQRPHLAYIGFQSLSPPSDWSSDPAFTFDSSALADAHFYVTDSMRNVVDALRAGCVPVLISDTLFYDLPFQDILQWHEFAVVMGASELARVTEVMKTMPVEVHKRMQYLGMQASLHMQWNYPPVAYDAFHLTMYQLWMRRHSVKYARRADS